MRAVVALDRPRAERAVGDPVLAREAKDLWELIRADAREADRELADAEPVHG